MGVNDLKNKDKKLYLYSAYRCYSNYSNNTIAIFAQLREKAGHIL